MPNQDAVQKIQDLKKEHFEKFLTPLAKFNLAYPWQNSQTFMIDFDMEIFPQFVYTGMRF